MLEKILEPFKYECFRQYNIANYKIDLYIKNINTCIEYDEDDHKNYSLEEQEKRKILIIKELNCRFIRVSDRDSNLWNCGFIMKCIFQDLNDDKITYFPR